MHSHATGDSRLLIIFAHQSSDFFFFNDTATTEIYTLSLHDALPIFFASGLAGASTNILRKSGGQEDDFFFVQLSDSHWGLDRKSTRLNSSHLVISYAAFCLKKKEVLRSARGSLREKLSLPAAH